MIAKFSVLPVKNKVYAYVLKDGPGGKKLLVFLHEDFPEAGIQVPGGTVEPGEEIEFAALREVTEETGLRGFRLVRKLGAVRRDMRGFGLEVVHHRHYFQFKCTDCEKREWIAYEETPSDGSEGPIALRLFWVPLEAVPVIQGGLDEMLSKLM